MKNKLMRIKSTLLLILVVIAIGNSSCIIEKYKETQLFDEYETQKGFGIFQVPSILFKLIFSLSDETEVPTELIDKIDLVKVLFFEQKSGTMKIQELDKSLRTKINKSDYTLLSRVFHEKDDISIFIIDKDSVIREVLITICSDKEYLCVNLVGELTKEEVMTAYEAINIKTIINTVR
ncbi:MAG: DUF4252 domain-containing protein [Bacteroidales bacterium]|nr:DUF4252 domain-containing protein [Bacteroidales bacterium]